MSFIKISTLKTLATSVLEKTSQGRNLLGVEYTKIRMFSTRVNSNSSLIEKLIKWLQVQEKKQWIRGGHRCLEGAKLFSMNTVKSVNIIKSRIKGNSLTRRDIIFLKIHGEDCLKIRPYIFFAMVPFVQKTFPILLKLFPNITPSTFLDLAKKNEKMDKELYTKLDILKNLQDELLYYTTNIMQKVHTKELTYAAKQFNSLLIKARDGNGNITSENIINYSVLFDKFFTLETFSTSTLIHICNFLNINAIGSWKMLYYKIIFRFRSIKADDKLIHKEGIESLNYEELEEASSMRGIHHKPFNNDISKNQTYMKQKLTEWITLSVEHDIPVIYLLLFRVFSQQMTRAST